MAQKLTNGLLKAILSIPCRKFHSVPSILRQLPLAARTASASVLPAVQRSRYSTDVALCDFLKEEIQAEREVAKNQMGSQTAHEISGFQVKADEADVTLTKTFKNEKISVHFNVNDCVSPQDDIETATVDKYSEQKPQQEEPKEGEEMSIMAEPSFRVEIEKNNQKLIFECDFVPEYQPEQHGEDHVAEDEESDLFNISAVYMTSGEVTEKVYGASGEILDGTLYDHLFDYLAERGIDNKFADELVRFATHYEHAQYVNLLQKLKEFVSQ